VTNKKGVVLGMSKVGSKNEIGIPLLALIMSLFKRRIFLLYQMVVIKLSIKGLNHVQYHGTLVALAKKIKIVF
jgi:hypothetical protein